MATQPNPDYTLTGRSTNAQGELLEGLIVRAYDQDPKTPENRLGKDAVTNTERRDKTTFTEKDFKVGGLGSGEPDVFTRLHDGDELLGESPVKRSSETRITIGLRADHVKADASERSVTYARNPMLVAEGGEE